jgi:hypothetical protein
MGVDMDQGVPGDRRARWSQGTRGAVKSLATFEQAPQKRWPLGLQAGIAQATPVLVGVAIGQESLGLIAATGAFTLLHMSALPTVERVRVLPIFALVLVVAAALGTVAAPSTLAVGIGLIAVSIAAGAGYFAFRVGPPGPVFVVLVFGLTTHATAPVDGVRHLSPGAAVGAIAAGATFACIVAAAPLTLGRHRAIVARPMREILPGPSLDATGRELLLRVSIVAVVATVVSLAFVDPTRAYWTVGAGIAVIGARAGRSHAARRGLHRIVGTILGAILYVALAWISVPPVAIAFILGGLQFIVEILVVRNYALALVFITPLVLILTSAATGGADPATVTERVIDTIVGGALGAATGLVHRAPRTLPSGAGSSSRE